MATCKQSDLVFNADICFFNYMLRELMALRVKWSTQSSRRSQAVGSVSVPPFTSMRLL